MVYAVPSNRPIVSKTPLKTTRVQGEHSKRVQSFMSAHDITAGRKQDGKTFIKVKLR